MIINSYLEKDRFISSNLVSSYFFIQGDFTIEIGGRQATFQTGSDYHHGNYNLPSNTLGFYEGDELLKLLDESVEDDINTDYINEVLETDYTEEYLNGLLLELREVIIECQQQVDELEQELEQEVEDGKYTYVLYTPIGADEDDNPRQDGYSYSMRFDEEEEADEYILSNNYSRIVDTETGLSNRSEDASNF